MDGFALLHPEDLEGVRQQFTALLDRPDHFLTLEYRLRHKDGTWRWMEGTLTNLLPDPAVGAVVCNYCDITQPKQEQERLRHSEERYRVLVEQAAVGIFVADLQDHIVEVNEVGCQLSGYSREELLQNVWGMGANTLSRTVDVHMAALRKKIEPDPRYPRFILTLKGAGYKLL